MPPLRRLLVCAFLLAGAPRLAAQDASALLHGALLPEGTPASDPRALPLADVFSPLAVDLGAPTRIFGLALQADADDVYFVESSLDAARWTLLWRVPPVPGPPGLRTRATRLGQPVDARYVRVRATFGPGGFAVSRLRILDSAAGPWPPALEYLPGAEPPLFPALSPERVPPLRNALAALALVACAWSLLAARAGETRRGRRLRRGFLGAVALLSALAFTNFLNFHYYGFVHGTDPYHYFIGGKYFPELGYTGLYECSLAAEAQDLGADAVRGREVRDLRTNQLVRAEDALASGEACHSGFSAARWDAFRRDVRYFRESAGPQWPSSLADHGFNAPPAWLLLGRALSGAVPASAASLRVLAAVDLVLLAALFFVLGRAFSFEAACCALLFFSLNSLSRFAWTGGALLRYDWLLLSGLGVAALRRGRDGMAGFTLAWATLLRIFPGCLIAGVVLKAAVETLAGGHAGPLRGLRRFALGATAGAVAIGGLGTLAAGRADAWHGFVANTQRFLGTQAENIVGLSVVAAYRDEMRNELANDPLLSPPSAAWEASQAETARRAAPWLLAARLPFLGLLGLSVYRRERWIAALLGLTLMPVLLRLAHYYYSAFSLFGLLYDVHPALGLASVAAAWASNLVADLIPQYDVRAAALSALMLALAVALVAALARLRRPPAR